MSEPRRRYLAPDEDSARWDGFVFRDGDIVISTRSKHGTTWMQMICALLVFQTPRLPAPLAELSPWLDWLVEPINDVTARLDAQSHRRFIKTHTPLDGVPIDDRATYIVVARDPLDAAVSLYHHGSNLDREVLHRLAGAPLATQPRRPIEQWVERWITAGASWDGDSDSLPGVLWHVSDAWARHDRPNVVLVHYADLSADLDGEMRRVAVRLGIDIDDDVWPGLVEAASFASMRERAAEVVPDRRGVIKDAGAFFRRGRAGAGRALVGDAEYARYLSRCAELASPELLAWLLR